MSIVTYILQDQCEIANWWWLFMLTFLLGIILGMLLWEFKEIRICNSRDVTSNKYSGPNPLMQTVVLQEVFKYLVSEQLRNCRLVSKLWNDVATTKMRKRSDQICFRRTEDLNDFTECALQSQKFPCTSFLLLTTELTPRPNIELFFSAVASWMTSLTLHCETEDIDQVMLCSGEPPKVEYPCLKMLRVRCAQSECPEKNNYFLLSHVLENSPNLEQLEVSYYGEDDAHLLNCFLDAMEKKNNYKLRCLELYILQIKNDHIIRLTQLQLQLLNFDLMSIPLGFPIDENVFRDFLQSQSSTLISLVMPEVTEMVIFPQMKSLKKLDLIGVQIELTNNNPTTFPNLTHKRQLPALRQLRFSEFKSDKWYEFFRHSIATCVRIESIQALDLSECAVIDEQNLFRVLTILPNIRKIGIQAEPTLFQIVCKLVPNLEALGFRSTQDFQLIDDIVTGFSEVECSQLRTLPKDILKEFCLDFGEKSEYSQNSLHLGCFKKLKLLRLWECENVVGCVEVTNVASTLVLNRMPTLTSVVFNRLSLDKPERLHDVFEDLGEKAVYTLIP